MREAGQLYIVGHVQAQRSGKRLRRVLLALIGELLGQLAQVDVEQAVYQLGILRRAMLQLHGRLRDCLDILHQLRMVVAIGVVVDARINLLGHDANLVERTHECVREATLSHVATSTAYIVIFQLIHILLAHDEHLREVIRALTHAQQLRLHERGGRKTPASARRGLIFHRRNRHAAHVSKLVTLSGSRSGCSRQQARK